MAKNDFEFNIDFAPAAGGASFMPRSPSPQQLKMPRGPSQYKLKKSVVITPNRHGGQLFC
jgi:hypothetical protein